MVLNLPQLELELSGKGYKVIDAITESRNNHNTLVDALNVLSKQLDDINTKLDAKADTDVVQSVTDIKDLIIPSLRQAITKNRDLSDAKIKDASDEINIKHEQLEAHGRRLNVIWNGRKEEKLKVTTQWGGTREYEDTEALFRDFLVTSLKFSPEDVGRMILRDCHRLPNKRGSTYPPPIIAAFVCQRNRNDVLAAAKNLKDTNFSIKSDLPKRLNEIRSTMLKLRSELKKERKIVRLVERNYLPILQQQESNRKWTIIYDIKGPKFPDTPDVEPVEELT